MNSNDSNNNNDTNDNKNNNSSGNPLLPDEKDSANDNSITDECKLDVTCFSDDSQSTLYYSA